MSNYKLGDNVDDDFTFELRAGKEYSMRYPRTEEVETVQEINARLEKAQLDKDEAAIKAASKELEEFLYGFITPVGHDTPIHEALKTENIKVMKNFNVMIRTELSLQ